MRTILLAAIAAFSICAQTTITDVVKAPTGELFRGQITITTPNQMTYAGETYVGWQKTIRIRSTDNGAFSQALIPNDNATPAGTSYTVQYLPDQGTGWTEFWVVTTSASPLKINQVRVAKAPTVNLSIIAAQIIGGTNGFCLKSNGFVGIWGTCGGGGTWGSITGTLTAQTDLASALSGKEPTITAGTSLQVWLGNKTWQSISGLSIDWSQIFNAPVFFSSAGYGLSGTGSEVSADDAELVSYQWSTSDPVGVGSLGKLHVRTTTGELFFGDGAQWLGVAKKLHTHVAADVTDFATAARAAFSGTAGRISYNSSTGVYDLVGGIVSAGVCLKPTVDTYGRVTGCASLASGDLPSHTHDAGDIGSGTLLPPRGGTGNTAPAANEVLIGNASSGYTKTTLPDCSNSTTSKLLYNNTTRTFSCGTDQAGGGGTFLQNLSNNFAGNTIAGATTTYGGLNDGITSYGTETAREIILVAAGTLKNFFVRTGTTQPGTGDLVVTVRKNGAATAIALTVAASTAAGTFSDLVNTVSVAQGDRIAIQFAEGTGTSAQVNAVALGFQQ